LRQSDQIESLVDDTIAEWGSLAVLVNNAAVFPGPASLEQTDAATFNDTIAVNLRAPFLLSRAAAPALRAERGAIVNLSDAWASRALPGRAAHLASKAGLEGLTRALARDLAPAIRVNAVAPGLIDWPDEMPEKTREAVRGRIPLGRRGTPEEVAHAVLHLLESEWITGTVLRVDGGR
jgi:pteridine reductase